MTEKQFLKLINGKSNKKGKFTYVEIVNLLSEDKEDKKFFVRMLDKITKNSPEKIIKNNLELIIDKLDYEDTYKFIDLFLKNRHLKPLLKENIQKILKKLILSRKDLKMTYKLLNDSNLLDDNVDFIVDNNPHIEHIFHISKYVKGKSNQRDERLENYFKARKLEFSRYLLEQKIDSNNDKLINDFSLTTSVLIEEILEGENARYIDIEYVGRGEYSNVYKIKDKILKIGEPRGTYQIPNHRRILQPLIRTRLIDEENNIDIGCIEITDRVETLSRREKNLEKLYELYEELREDGIIWPDIQFENVGKLKKENVPNINRKEMYVDPGSVGFLNKLNKNKEPLKKGDWVIIDSDFIYEENAEEIAWQIRGKGIEFEYRYNNEKNPQKRKKEVKKFIEELDFDER